MPLKTPVVIYIPETSSPEPDVLERLTAYVVASGLSPSKVASAYTAFQRGRDSVTWITITRWLKRTSFPRGTKRVQALDKFLKKKGF